MSVIDRLRAYRESAPLLPIRVDVWDLDCFVRPISAGRHATLRTHYGSSESRMAAQLIIHALVDADGKPVFEDNAATMAELENQPSGLITRIAMRILSQMGADADLDAAKN